MTPYYRGILSNKKQFFNVEKIKTLNQNLFQKIAISGLLSGEQKRISY